MDDLGKMMREVYRAFKKRAEEQQNQEIRLSPEQFSILHAISLKEDDVIQKDLAELMGKDKSAILRLIDSLEEKQLVRRVASLNDRRKNYLMVTKLGNRVIGQYMEIVHGLIRDLQQGLDQSQIDTFRRVVSHVKSQAENLNVTV